MALDDFTSALVTGASSGIGAAVVRSLRARGLTVYAAARREARLEALAEESGCDTLVLDVRDTARNFELIGGLDVDIVINNAGLGRGFGKLHEAALEDIDTTIDTNVHAAIHVLRASLPGMLYLPKPPVPNILAVGPEQDHQSSCLLPPKGSLHGCHSFL